MINRILYEVDMAYVPEIMDSLIGSSYRGAELPGCGRDARVRAGEIAPAGPGACGVGVVAA